MFGPLTEASRRGLCTSLIVTPLSLLLRAHTRTATMLSRRPLPTATSQVPTGVGSCSEISVALLGDVMLGRYVSDQFTVADRKQSAFGSVLPLLSRLDSSTSIVAGNLECAVTKHLNPTPKAFNFKLAPEHADVLQQLRLAHVSLANNHVLDYQLPGLLETHEVLDQLGIAHSGSGRNLHEASSPAIVHCAGYKIAFLSYADHYDDWAAGEDTPGINFVDPASAKSRQHVQQQISAVQADHDPDLLIIFIHWGPNWQWQPDRHIRQLGREMIEAGADFVFGHSAHHIQGVEFVDEKPIIYGAGGFIDDYTTDAIYRNDLGCMWLAQFVAEQSAAGGAAAGRLSRKGYLGGSAAAAKKEDTDYVSAEGEDSLTAPAAADHSKHAVDIKDHVGASANTMSSSATISSIASAVATDSSRPTGNAAAADLLVDQQVFHSSSNWRFKPLTVHMASVPAAAKHTSAAEHTSAVSKDRGKLRLHSLTAVPIRIHHIRREGQHKEPGEGDPPYFSQVDLAEGSDYDWVANKLQHLCLDMGTAMIQLPDDYGLQLKSGHQC